jgi:hypothetical protein
VNVLLLWQEKLSDETFIVSIYIVCIVEDGRPIQLSLVFDSIRVSTYTVFSRYLGHLPHEYAGPRNYTSYDFTI